MKRPQPYNCGLGPAMRVIGGKWKPTILWELHAAPVRFRELRRRIPGISEKVLYEQLREMEASGIVHRDDRSGRLLHVEYSVTEIGASLNDAVHALAMWGTQFADDTVNQCQQMLDAHAR
ncbi:winged helix-turn-helix transcriptional regulator [Luteimonas cucumeris]|nr:helix-turn-helix domain-containing protein [Luteimonas cucumeris]